MPNHSYQQYIEPQLHFSHMVLMTGDRSKPAIVAGTHSMELAEAIAAQLNTEAEEMGYPQRCKALIRPEGAL